MTANGVPEVSVLGEAIAVWYGGEPTIVEPPGQQGWYRPQDFLQGAETLVPEPDADDRIDDHELRKIIDAEVDDLLDDLPERVHAEVGDRLDGLAESVVDRIREQWPDVIL